MSQTIDRVRMTSQGGPFGMSNYDSAGDEDPGNAPGEVDGRCLSQDYWSGIRRSYENDRED